MATAQTTNDLSIRPMSFRDIEQIVGIENSVSEEPWPSLAFLGCLQKACPAFVIVHQDTVVGYALAMQVQDEAHILNFAIAPAWQRRGLGAQLLTFLITEIRKATWVSISLEVNANNQAAIRLYKAHGFIEKGVRKNYYCTSQGPVDALILVSD